MTEPLELSMDVRIEVSGKWLGVQELLDIDEADLSNEFACQAARYAYFAVLEARAEYTHLEATFARKRAEADAFSEFKSDEALIPKGSRTVTDAYANHLCQLDEECIETRELEIATKRRYRIMRAISDAFRMRGEMLRSLGANLRAEQDMTGMAVKERVENNAEFIRAALARARAQEK